MTYRNLATAVLILTYALIILGGATRVFDAGVSCPDWPSCYGHLIPFPESRIPGGYIVNGLHYHWWQVALEWTHRTLAALVSLGVLALVALGIRRPRHERKPLIAMVALLGIQIGLGGLTVLRGNIDWSVMLHLGTAMLFFASLLWLRRAVASGGRREPMAYPAFTKAVVYLFALVVWVTMLMGAMVSSSYSGGSCGGLFSCGGQWWPADLQQHLNMMHRYLALTTAITSVILVILAKRTAPAKGPNLRASAMHSHGMVWGQVALGIATLYSFAYYPAYYQLLSTTHLAWGTLVWLAAFGTILTLHYGNHGRFHAQR